MKGTSIKLTVAGTVVHLRDGPMMELVTPTIRKGGVNTVFVMVRRIIISIKCCLGI